MNKREAKRIACRAAAGLLRRWLQAELSESDFDDMGAVAAIDKAGEELAEELERRAYSSRESAP